MKSIFTLAFLCVLLATNVVAQEEGRKFQLLYRDGTSLTTGFVGSTLMWTDVSDLGQMTKKPIDVATIKSLTLTIEPASTQLAEILKYINQLDSDNFFERDEAELMLRKVGSRFRAMMERSTKMKTPDGSYRLKRLLSSLRSSSKGVPAFALDVLELEDGSTFTGDAGIEGLEFFFPDEKKVAIERKAIERISQANALVSTRAARPQVYETKLFHNHADFMETPGLRMVDFENKPDGTVLRSLDKNISEAFVNQGLILGTEFPMGCVGISGYDIKGGDRPVGGNSVCVYQSKTRTVKRFKGVMEITFCQPGKQTIPHGVMNIGMFISRVNHSRDMLVEAYDSMDRLIGVCESTDEPCTFCGIQSTVPIAKVRVLSNPWLMELRRANVPAKMRALQKVDTDYAVDSIMFSDPVAVDSLRKEKHFLGRNGDLVAANWIRIFDKDRIELGARNIQLMSFGLDDAITIALKPIPKILPNRKTDKSWMAMLRDNSVVRWSPDSLLQSSTLGEKLSREDVIAIWPACTKIRLPLENDLKDGGNVIVYPGCRVLAKVDFDEKGFRWFDGEVRVEDLHEMREDKVDQRADDLPDAVEPRKTDYSYDMAELPVYETPTIWFKKPSAVLSNQGVLRLDRGEVIVYGRDALFQLKSLDARQVVLTYGEKELTIPLKKIVAIVPPQSQDSDAN